MHDASTLAEIKRLYYAEHWRVGTIATQLGVHPEVVSRAVNRVPGTLRRASPRRRQIDPFLPWLTETLERYPKLAATVLHRMLCERGYPGGVVQLRRIVRRLRPRRQEAFLRLSSLPGEAAQVDWADFGRVKVDRAERRLSAFVMTLCHSRALYVEFFFDQSLVSFLRGHIRGFEHFGGVARTVVTDNLRSVVLERRGEQIRFHPRYLELAGHYGFEPRPCHVARGNEKGRVERSIRFLRESFFAVHAFTGLSALNAGVKRWVEQIADARPWPDDRCRTCAEVFAGVEQARLLALPLHPLDTSERVTVRSRKTLWVRFDRNDYSIPPQAVGKELTLLASDTEVRLLDGSAEIARHRRGYGQGERVTDPAHTNALLESKRAARAGALDSPLRLAVPEVSAFLTAAFPRYRNSALLTTPLERLLGLYGREALRAAVREALQRGTPTLASVEYLLEKNRRQAQRRPPLPVDLADRPDLAALHVQPHDLDAYDRLSRRPAEQDRLDGEPQADEEGNNE
jgi:transposase